MYVKMHYNSIRKYWKQPGEDDAVYHQQPTNPINHLKMYSFILFTQTDY